MSVRQKFVLVATAMLLGAAFAVQADAPQLINFQGVLTHNGSPVTGQTNVVYEIWNAQSGGTMMWSETWSITPDETGAYSVLLGNGGTPVPDAAFDGEAWLCITVEGEVFDRVQLASVPSAYRVRKLDGAEGGHLISGVTVAGVVEADGFKLDDGAQLGYVLTSDIDGFGTWQPPAAVGYWELDGNTGTNPPTDFLGTTDQTRFVLKVNNKRALRIRPSDGTTSGFWDNSSPNITMGHDANVVGSSFNGGTISGGGFKDPAEGMDWENSVNGDFGTVGGGVDNKAGENATVAGGLGNTAAGDGAMIPGGWNNIAVGARSFAAGTGCEAMALNSFALGKNAVADDAGSFIWAHDDVPHSTTASNQFKVLASGGIQLHSAAGVTINCGDPGSFTLAVDGSIGAREVRVTQADPWPDYVFDEDYDLKKLSDLEKFLAENKHLPGIPSADLVSAEGIDLGKMQGRLLEKVEELTLYVLELNKENESLRRRIETLEQR